ncbi:hypothetical protein [Nocardia sp. NPDC003979]
MPEHQQMQPPDYHRCIETVLDSPSACHQLLKQLSQAHSPLARWKGQKPTPYGTEVDELVPAEVRLAALQATYDSHLEMEQQLWRRLYDVMGIPPMQYSAVELIECVRQTIEQLHTRIAQLEDQGADEGQ